MKTDSRFPRSLKLVNKTDFQTIFDQSVKVSERFLLALYKPNQKMTGRLGIIVGKRVSNSAVTRNSIKRVVRESFRAKQMQLCGIDVIIIARHSCNSLDKLQLREGIEKLWLKLITQYQKSSL